MSLEGLSLRLRIVLVVAAAFVLVIAPLSVFVSCQLRPIFAWGVVGVLGALAVSVVLYFLLGALIVRPLDRLLEGMNVIRGGDPAYTLPIAGDNEFSLVASTFNVAADRLRERVADLEQRLAERTAALENHSRQLEMVRFVIKEAAQVSSVSMLLETTVKAISEKFGFYHVGIFILDDARNWAILSAASSEGGRRMLARGHRLRVGHKGIVGYVSGTGKPRIALDVGEDAVWFSNPDLPATHSEIALPLTFEDEVIGVLDIQSTESSAFTDEDVRILQLMADQLVIALNNARTMENTQDALAEVDALQMNNSRQGWVRISRQSRSLAYEYDRVDVNPVPPLPVPTVLLEGRATRAEVLDGGVPVVMESLRAGGRVLGYLGLADSQRVWSEEELSLVESVSEQVALALENARLFEESQQSQRQQALISSVLQIASNPEFSYGQVLQEIARTLARALGLAAGVYTFPQIDAPRIQPHPVLTPTGETLPVPTEIVTLSDEHHIFLRGLTHIELGPATPLLGDMDLAALSVGDRTLLEIYNFDQVFYVPLGAAGTLRGFVVLMQYRMDALPLDPETRNLVDRLARQIAVVLDNLTLTEETQQRSEELQSLYRISLVLSELLEPEDVLSAIVEQGTALLAADGNAFFVYDPATGGLVLMLDSQHRDLGQRLERDEGLPGRALAEQRSLFVTDMGLDEVEYSSPSSSQGQRFNALLAVPLIGRFGPQGVLMLRSRETGSFGEREARLADLFAQQAAAALDNARLNKDAQRRADEFSMLSQAGVDMLPIRKVEDLLATAADWTRRIFDVPRVVIFLRDEINDRYLRGRSLEDKTWVLADERGTPSAGGLTETMIRTNQSILVHDNREHPGETSRRLVAAGLLSQMGVPLRVGDDVLGVIFVSGTEANQFDERALHLLEFLATQVASAIQNVFQFARTEAALSVVRRQARYQANVSQAAALLTERGTDAISDVLRLLGEASEARAAIYLEFHEDAGNLHWQGREIWTSADVPERSEDHPRLSYLPSGDLVTWADQLIERPFVAVQLEALSENEREMFQALGIGALLVLAVRGETSYPSVIVLGREAADTEWAEEEVVALQTAAVTLSNTIARERVFQEVQASRTETEALYRGSAELNVAQTYDGILNVVRTYTALGQGAHHMTLQLFNHPWTDGHEPEYAEVVAHWTSTGASILRERFYLADFPASREFAQSSGAMIIEDVARDARLTRRNRALFVRVYKATTMIFVPLIAGGQKIGYLHAMYPHPVQFTDPDRRRLESLTQQAAIAVQNRLQLLTIEARVNRERMIREITESIQAAPDVQGVLQAAIRELGRALGTSRNQVRFRPSRQDDGSGHDR